MDLWTARASGQLVARMERSAIRVFRGQQSSPYGLKRRASDDNHEESDNHHEEEEERLEGRKRRRLSLSADRCENQGAEGLAGRDASGGTEHPQAGLARHGRGVEVGRGCGVVARR